MTEKEILYMEDTVNHFVYMDKICNDAISIIEDKTLKKEVQKVQNSYQKLTNMFMEVLENE